MSLTQRYFLQFAYNGQAFNGWQVQLNTITTVQQVMQEAMRKLLSEHDLNLIGCGRTDTGVHAEDFYAHFDSYKKDLHEDPDNFLFKLNKILPKEIAVKKTIPVHDKASARYDAVSRVYEYRITRKKDAFLADFTWFIFGKLNFEKMQKACEIYAATSDFASFAKSNDQKHDNTCIVKEVKLFEREDGVWVFRIEANRFIRNMVRALVGTMVKVGKEKISVEDLHKIIADRDRKSAGMSAPAQGLFLVKVNYKESLFEKMIVE
ncbi:MAG: tRNA pseudouridine(38-40) synthase TruA [Bacteroidia bacterium]|nr:tRNA pseudouridine(38-40) synthase TruA [Bacteroidia bacterium]